MNIVHLIKVISDMSEKKFSREFHGLYQRMKKIPSVSCISGNNNEDFFTAAATEYMEVE